MMEKKFNPKKIDRLNDPERLQYEPPDLIWDTLKLKNPGVLIDVGAGTGFFSIPFSEKMEDGIVYACDTSDVMIEWMQENFPTNARNRVIPMKTTENGIDLPDGIADLVYMINLHHELHDPTRMLQETRRLLKKGGILLIIDWKKNGGGKGPSEEIRVPVEIVKAQMETTGFQDVRQYPVLKYHYFFTGTAG